MIATIIVSLAGFYLLCGIIFAVPFVMVGAGRIDPHAAHGSWGFRVLIVPGTTLLWPLLAKRWLQGVHGPPEEKTAHRLAAKCKVNIANGALADPSATPHSAL